MMNQIKESLLHRYRKERQGELIKKLIKERKELIKLIGGEWLWNVNTAIMIWIILLEI